VRERVAPKIADDAAAAVTNRSKLLPHHLLSLCQCLEEQHAEGRAVTNSKAQNFIRITFEIEVTNRSVRRHFARLGFSWQKTKKKKRTLDGCRIDAARDFLLKPDKLVIDMEDKNIALPVCTDKLCLHNNHSSGMSHCRSKELMRKSGSKGERLVILHAVTPDGPLCEMDPVTNVPHDDLIWTGNVPHPKAFEKRNGDKKCACKLLWVSSSSTGDHHDIMNSDMHMKWMIEKLAPTFEKLLPGKQMLLMQDNAAPRHHKRRIPSLSSMTKKKLLELAAKHEVECVDLPMSLERRACEEGADLGECLRVEMDLDAMAGIAGKNRPHAPNVSELRMGIVKYFQEHRPGLLECKVEKCLHDHGHDVLWTPSHCPDLQPIELWWAAGKNGCTLMPAR
jgi:hypothetical protein